jgi:hypothetical protein
MNGEDKIRNESGLVAPVPQASIHLVCTLATSEFTAAAKPAGWLSGGVTRTTSPVSTSFRVIPGDITNIGEADLGTGRVVTRYVGQICHAGAD